MATNNKEFKVKHGLLVQSGGLNIGNTEVINSSGVVASSALTNVATQLTVIGRSANTDVSISNAAITVVGRSANVSIGVS